MNGIDDDIKDFSSSVKNEDDEDRNYLSINQSVKSQDENSLDRELEGKLQEMEFLQREISDLCKEGDKLDQFIHKIKSNFEKLHEDQNFKDFGYVTFDDIKALTSGDEINLIAVKALPGTSVEIPDPEQIHKIYLQTCEVT